MTPKEIHPISNKTVPRAEKQRQLKQRAHVVWLFGLSGAGKSTLAVSLEEQLFSRGFCVHLLDGDNLRSGLNRDLGFVAADRDENIRRAAEVARLFVEAGVIVICAFITPFKQQRMLARQIITADDFTPVFVSASFETCERRDPKGIYARARSGQVARFTGLQSPFENPAPEEGAIVIDTESSGPDQAVQALLNRLVPMIQPAS